MPVAATEAQVRRNDILDPHRRLRGGDFVAAHVAAGSASDSTKRDLTAGKLTPKVSDLIADVRGRQWPNLQRLSPD
jgi:hypothetical protein